MKFDDNAVLQAAATIVAAQIARDKNPEVFPGPEISHMLYEAVAAVRAVDFALVEDGSMESMATWKKLGEDVPR